VSEPRAVTTRIAYPGCVVELLAPTDAERRDERRRARERVPDADPAALASGRDPLDIAKPEPRPLPHGLASRQRPLF